MQDHVQVGAVQLDRVTEIGDELRQILRRGRVGARREEVVRDLTAQLKPQPAPGMQQNYGIRNLLVLRGDDPTAGDQPDAKPVFDLDSGALIETAVGIRDRGELPSGRKVTGKAEFFIGAADMPLDPPADWQPKSLKAKIAACAQFAQTQFCMDIEVVRRYVARLSDYRLTDRIALLIGVVPLKSARSARWIKEHLYGAIIPDDIVERLEYSGDPAAEGRQICVDFIEHLATVPGVAGAHVMAPNHEAAIPDVITRARVLVTDRAKAPRKARRAG